MKTSSLNLTYFTKYCYAFKNNRSELAKEIAKRLKDGCSVSDRDILNLLKNVMYDEAIMCIAYKATPINTSSLLKSSIDHDSLPLFRFIADISHALPQFYVENYDPEILAKFKSEISYYHSRNEYLYTAFQLKSFSFDETTCLLKREDIELIKKHVDVLNIGSDYQTFVKSLFNKRLDDIKQKGLEMVASY